MRRKIIPYNPQLKELARQLRNNSTKSEIRLWNYLKNGKMLGYDFHRQKPIGNYILDFYCPDLLFAIELDGLSHEFEEVQAKDQLKAAFLTSVGVELISFNDTEVMNDLDNILRTIANRIELIAERKSNKSGTTKIVWSNNELKASYILFLRNRQEI